MERHGSGDLRVTQKAGFPSDLYGLRRPSVSSRWVEQFPVRPQKSLTCWET